MSGTKIGGKRAAEKNLAKDPEFYKKIGSMGGGKTGIKKGFALMPEDKHRAASAKGGRRSRRGQAK